MNEFRPLVTVVIPTYNYENMVVRAIESVKAQTLNNLECFIVDDGSTDNTAEVVAEAIKHDSRFQYICQENQGVAHARNNGVFSGTAPFVCCLDADDAIAPEFLQTCVEEMLRDRSVGIAYTGLWYIKPDGEEGLSPWPAQFDFDKQVNGMNQIPTCNVSRREIWERLGGQRQRYAPLGAGEEDGEFWLRAGAIGWNARKVTEAGMFIYSWLSGRVSGGKDHQMTDWLSWHPWTKDGEHPFASMAKPQHFSHPVRQYDEPVVSVIIPVGPGHEEDVINALDSLDAQTFRQWEVIVVFDCCPEYEWSERFNKAFPHAKMLTTAITDEEFPYSPTPYELPENKPKGAGRARNIGAEHARAPLLLFLDADDWLYPAALETMVKAWEVDQSIIYSDYVGKTFLSQEKAAEYGDRLLFYRPETEKAVVSFTAATYDCERAVAQPMIDSSTGYLYVWNLISSLVPRDWHDEIGGFDEKMPSWEDWDYWIRMAKAGKCFVRVKEPLIVYQFASGNRREIGLHAAPDLIQYLKDKYRGITDMACGCKKERTSPVSVRRPGQSQVQSMAVQERRNETLEDQDVLLCLYDHPNRGTHRVVGTATGRDYGYRGGGAQFYVHKDDIAAQPHVFKPIQIAPKAEVAASGPRQTAPPPPPKQVAKPPPPPPEPEPEPIVAEEPDIREQEEEESAVEYADFQLIPGISAHMAQELNAAGAHTYEDILRIGVSGLMKVKGIGERKAELIIEYIESLD